MPLLPPHEPVVHPDTRSSVRAVRWLLVAGVLLCLALVWRFPYFPTQDGPAHLETAWILLNFHEKSAVHYPDYFSIQWRPVPNWGCQALLAGLMTVVAPPVAEKLLLSLYFVAWPLAFLYLLRSFTRRADWLALLALPLALNFFLFMGFYNFILSLPLFCGVVGFWTRHVGPTRPGRGVALALLSLALYFCHLVSAGMAWLAIGLLLAMRWRAGGRSAASRGLRRRRWVWTIASASATVAGAVWFLAAGGTGARTGPLYEVSLAKLQDLLMLRRVFLAFDRGEWPGIALISLTMVLLVGAAVRASRHARRRPADRLLPVTLLFALIYLGAPRALGSGTYLIDRLEILLLFPLLVWTGARPVPRAVRRGLIALGLCGLVWMVQAHWRSAARFQAVFADLESLESSIHQRAWVLPLSSRASWPLAVYGGTPYTLRVWPQLHFTSRMAVRGPFLNLGNYQFSTDYFPVRWRPQFDPLPRIGPIDHPGADIDLARYANPAADRSIECLLIWSPWNRQDFNPALRRRIEQDYRPQAASAPLGWAQGWGPWDAAGQP